MSETAPIATIAKRVSDELFAVFGWQARGPEDQNWPCRKNHSSRIPAGPAANKDSGDSRTHPSDVVFRYDDPYTDGAVYITTDLKSYAAGSIDKTAVGKALRSLCNSVDCANVVHEWQNMYVSGDERWQAHGMLFVYNHDGAYEPDRFTRLVRDATPGNIKVPLERRVFVLGPGEIAHLYAVSRDLLVERGRKPGTSYRWFTPDLIIRKSRSPSFGPAAPLEVLLGAWQIAGVVEPNGDLPTRLRMYYRCHGKVSTAEIEYIVEFLFRYRLLDYNIDLCFVGAQGGVLAEYEAAINNVVEGLYGLKEFRERLKRVAPIVLSEFQSHFATVDIGMERGS